MKITQAIRYLVGLLFIGLALVSASDEAIQATIILSAVASTTTTNQINFIPQFITFTASTVPTSLKITTLSAGVIMDLDGAGCTQFNLLRQYGGQSNVYVYQISDGKVEGVQAEITMNNAVAAQVDVKEWSEDYGNAFIQMLKSTVLDGTESQFEDFAYWAVTAPGANDTLTMEFKAGNPGQEGRIVQNVLDAETIAARTQYFQNNVGVYVVDNVDQTIRRVSLIPSGANRAVYQAKYIPLNS